MRATLEFLNDRFGTFNRTIFGNSLPTPIMRISSARSFMGQFKVVRSGPAGRRRETYYLTVSDRYDMDEATLEDIIIHEMIHFHIHHSHIKDSSSHGPAFRRIMEQINIRHGRHITVSHRCTGEQLDSDTTKSHSLICLCTMTDGRRLMCRASQSRVFELHRAFQEWDKVAEEKWYMVYGSYFNRYRRVLTPKLFSVDEEGIRLIESGVRLEFSAVSGGRMTLRPATPMRR